MMYSEIKINKYYVLFSVLFVAASFYINFHYIHDDAYITLRYVNNYINGNGIVWNPGEYVQGYTNFLYLQLIAIFNSLTSVNLEASARWIGVISFVAIVFGMLANRHLYSKEDTPVWFKNFPALIVVTSSPLILWSIGGLETVLYSALVFYGFMGLFRVIEEKTKTKFLTLCISGVALGLSFLCRPDGAIFILLAGTGFLLRFLVLQKKANLLQLTLLVISVSIIVLPYLYWQYQYYGDIFPNTYYAKSGAPFLLSLKQGLSYFLNFTTTPIFLPIFLLGSIIIATLRKGWDEVSLFILVIISIYSIYLVKVGGDHMWAFRMIVPLIPFMVILTFRLLVNSIVLSKKPYMLILSIAGLIGLQLFSYNLQPKSDPAARVGKAIGLYINENWPPNSLVALNTAGSTPYFAPNIQFIDMIGLNDAVIAKREVTQDDIVAFGQNWPGHLKGDGAYIIERAPDYIIIGPAQGSTADSPWFLSDYELNQLEAFHTKYKKQIVQLGNLDLNFTYYEKRAEL